LQGNSVKTLENLEEKMVAGARFELTTFRL